MKQSVWKKEFNLAEMMVEISRTNQKTVSLELYFVSIMEALFSCQKLLCGFLGAWQMGNH